MNWIGLDVGGANLKLADGHGLAISRPFALWRHSDALPAALAELLSTAPADAGIALTMTGELADCFKTRREGVASILAAVESAAAGRPVRVYGLDGGFVDLTEARREPLRVAAANWRALAAFAGRYAQEGRGLLVDIGSTTCDLIPLVRGQPMPQGECDSERLISGELVYTGVRRSPVCAIVGSAFWKGQPCPTAHEMFATSWDAYLVLGLTPEEPARTDTADGRPATRSAAAARLARCVCADLETFSEADVQATAHAVKRGQMAKLGVAAQAVLRRMTGPPATVVLAGEGEFLGPELLARLRIEPDIVSLAEELGPLVSACAPAHALAVLAAETL